MKRFLALFAVAAALLFVSCSKENPEDDKEAPDNSTAVPGDHLAYVVVSNINNYLNIAASSSATTLWSVTRWNVEGKWIWTELSGSTVRSSYMDSYYVETKDDGSIKTDGGNNIDFPATTLKEIKAYYDSVSGNSISFSTSGKYVYVKILNRSSYVPLYIM